MNPITKMLTVLLLLTLFSAQAFAAKGAPSLEREDEIARAYAEDFSDKLEESQAKREEAKALAEATRLESFPANNNRCPDDYYCRVTRQGAVRTCIYDPADRQGSQNCSSIARTCDLENLKAPGDRSSFFLKYCSEL